MKQTLIQDDALVFREAAATFTNADFVRLGLAGLWHYRVAAVDYPVNFTVKDGALVLSGGIGPFRGATATDAPGVLVLRTTEEDEGGPPVETLLNLQTVGPDRWQGFSQSLGGDEDEPIPVVVVRSATDSAGHSGR